METMFQRLTLRRGPTLRLHAVIWCRTFCQRCFGYFSLNTKSFVNNKTPKEHEDRHPIYTARPPSSHRLWQWSPTKARRTHQLGGTAFGGDEKPGSDTHTPPNVFYCICPVSTQWGRFAVISQHVNETPLFLPLATSPITLQQGRTLATEARTLLESLRKQALVSCPHP